MTLLYFAIRLESRKSANKRIYLSIYLSRCAGYAPQVQQQSFYTVRKKRSSQLKGDVTATSKKHVYFSASLQPITMQESVWAWSTSRGVIVYCYFHVFRLINRDNLLYAVIFLFN